jgi:DNA-binding transcriptional MerR regulator
MLKQLEEQGPMKLLMIGDVARETGLSVAAIRYYEAEKLLPSPDRLASNRRVYGRDILKRIAFIQGCRNAGMSLSDIGRMLALLSRQARPCAEALNIADRASKELSRRIAELQAARRELSRLAASCGPEQCGPSASDCAMLSGLGAS